MSAIAIHGVICFNHSHSLTLSLSSSLDVPLFSRYSLFLAQVGPLCELCAPGYSLENHVCSTCVDGAYVQLTSAGIAVLVIGAVAGAITATAYYRRKKCLPPPTHEDIILVLSCQCWGKRRLAKMAQRESQHAKNRYAVSCQCCSNCTVALTARA